MEYTEEHLMIRDMARDFATAELAPNSAQWDREATFPREAIREMGNLGLLGMLVPENYGGAATDNIAYSMALEEIAAGDGACSTIMSVHNSVGCLPILNYGSDEQKDEFLTALARVGNQWVLNGTKQFITSGSTADLAIVFAVTDPSAGKRGMSAFIVPTNTAGYEVASTEHKMGQRASDTCQIIFNDCKIPAGNLLGEAGEGYKIALSNLEGGRIGIASQSIGMARAAYQAAFGKPIFEQQSIAFSLADMATQIDAARLLTHRAAGLRNKGESCLTEASMAKLFASEMAEKVCSAAIQIHGGYGYLSDFPVERIARDVRVCQIYEGTSEVQRLVISRALPDRAA